MDSKKNKLLILNGSHSDSILIQKAKELGYYVITTGNDANMLGHKYADEYHKADFSNKDEVLELAKKLEINYVCACANDFGAITASYVAEKMSLPGHDPYETTLDLHHKDRFKKIAIPNNIPTPYSESYDDEELAISNIGKYQLPLIIKPIDLTGGKGVSVARSVDECKTAIKKAFSMSKAKHIVIEEFIEGTQHSFTTFLLNKKVVFSFSDNEYSFKNQFLVSTSAAPATDIELVKQSLIDASEKLAKIMDLGNGVFHHQYLLRDGKPYIIEITRRCSGDLYPVPVQHATGVDWATWIVKAQTGMDCSDFPLNVEQKGFCGRHCIMPPHNGKVKDVIISDEIKNNIFDELMWWEDGYKIDDYMAQKVGIVFFEFSSQEEMLDKVARINDLIKIEFY